MLQKRVIRFTYITFGLNTADYDTVNRILEEWLIRLKNINCMKFMRLNSTRNVFSEVTPGLLLNVVLDYENGGINAS